MQTIAQQLNIKTFPFKIKVDGNMVYHEDSYGYWAKYEYQDGERVYFEDSNGTIRDNRPKSKAHAKVAEARKLLEEAEKELEQA